MVLLLKYKVLQDMDSHKALHLAYRAIAIGNTILLPQQDQTQNSLKDRNNEILRISLIVQLM